MRWSVISGQWSAKTKSFLITDHRPLTTAFTAIQLSNIKSKRSGYSWVSINPCVTAPKNFKRESSRVLLSMFRERERRSRCVNLAVSNDRYRSVWVDNSMLRGRPRRLQTDSFPPALCLRRLSPWAVRLYVTNFGSSKFLPKNSADIFGEVRILTQVKNRCQAIFLKKFSCEAIWARNGSTLLGLI